MQGHILTYLLDDVGHTLPVCQFDVVSPIHQALVSLKSNFPYDMLVLKRTMWAVQASINKYLQYVMFNEVILIQTACLPHK